jgi:hypothetical protein
MPSANAHRLLDNCTRSGSIVFVDDDEASDNEVDPKFTAMTNTSYRHEKLVTPTATKSEFYSKSLPRNGLLSLAQSNNQPSSMAPGEFENMRQSMRQLAQELVS